MRKLLTLCIIQREGEVLLGMKKRGFGAGLYNGFGGKVEDKESVLHAVVRETREESGITVHDPKQLGVLEFSFLGQADILEVHIFKASAYSGTVGESEEMAPRWFSLRDIPFASMWKDDPLWFPYFLENKKFRGAFRFDGEHQIVASELFEIQNF